VMRQKLIITELVVVVVTSKDSFKVKGGRTNLFYFHQFSTTPKAGIGFTCIYIYSANPNLVCF
jgi:hypothetical protein